MHHRPSRNPPPPHLSKDSFPVADSEKEQPQQQSQQDLLSPEVLTPQVHIEDASPSVFTFSSSAYNPQQQQQLYSKPTTQRSSSPAYKHKSSGSGGRGSSVLPQIQKPLISSQPRLAGFCQTLAMLAVLSVFVIYFLFSPERANARSSNMNPNYFGKTKWGEACPDYTDYAGRVHPPFSNGPLKLPFQRPTPECRTFVSKGVERVVSEVTGKLVDKDLARLFENCYPSTLDTTVKWHIDSTQGNVQGPQSFIVTGDINAEWLRDSTNQLEGYQALVKEDAALKSLILGAIHTQADMVIQAPYCNAFQPPAGSNVQPANNGQGDKVRPSVDPSVVFECKYEIDSLANFLALGNHYFANTKDTSFVTDRWLDALDNVFGVLEDQSIGTFGADGTLEDPTYTFQRNTNIGTETLSLAGRGNPLNANSSLIRSAFRPSDDACILQYFIPGNAYMSVELKRTADVLRAAGKSDLASKAQSWSDSIRKGIEEHGIVDHKKYGRVYAFEVDGYGSHIIMDDANLPSLLSLPLLGFVDVNDEVYKNTRKMILSADGNPYFLRGKGMSGIGGPHIGLSNAWPMSLLVQAMTSDDDDEIMGSLETVKKVSRFGLINESINVNNVNSYTRPWFAWANSVYAQTILDLAKRKPYLLFGKGAKPYTP